MDIPAVAATQCWLFRYDEALMAGWDKADMETAIRRGVIDKVRFGVYAVAERVPALDSNDRHLFDVVAEQLGLGRRWYAARRSAAVLLGLPLIGMGSPRPVAPAVPQLLAARSSLGESARNRHRRLAPLPAEERWEWQGARLVTPARIVTDIAREESFRNAVVVADAVLGAGVHRSHVDLSLAKMRRWPGVAGARKVLSFADGLAESPLESISRVAIHELGLPAPELQVEVYLGDRLLGRVDKLWRAYNTVGEDDGIAKFGDDEQTRRAAFRRLKVRNDALEDVGFEVASWTWEEAWRPRGVLDQRIMRAFARGSAQVLDPGVRFVPTSVSDRRRREAG